MVVETGVVPLSRRVDPLIEDIRKRVLAAAFDVIAEHGIAGATLERIAERSGVSRTTINRRWPDPADVYLDARASPRLVRTARRDGEPTRRPARVVQSDRGHAQR